MLSKLSMKFSLLMFGIDLELFSTKLICKYGFKLETSDLLIN